MAPSLDIPNVDVLPVRVLWLDPRGDAPPEKFRALLAALRAARSSYRLPLELPGRFPCQLPGVLDRVLCAEFSSNPLALPPFRIDRSERLGEIEPEPYVPETVPEENDDIKGGSVISVRASRCISETYRTGDVRVPFPRAGSRPGVANAPTVAGRLGEYRLFLGKNGDTYVEETVGDIASLLAGAPGTSTSLVDDGSSKFRTAPVNEIRARLGETMICPISASPPTFWTSLINGEGTEAETLVDIFASFPEVRDPTIPEASTFVGEEVLFGGFVFAAMGDWTHGVAIRSI